MIHDRHADREHPEDGEADVDVHLEQDITMVQQATDAYLGAPGERQRQALLSALESLDRRTAASDAYEESVVGSAVFGTSSKGSVIGETGSNPIAEEVPASVFRAQIDLVKAAKAAVTGPSPSSLEGLRAASAALASAQPPAGWNG
jgi:hypothetical protein